MWKVARHWFRRENDRRHAVQRAGYHPVLESQGPDTAAMSEAAYMSCRYLQLKSGHVVTDMYLRHIRRAGMDRCWKCTS